MNNSLIKTLAFSVCAACITLAAGCGSSKQPTASPNLPPPKPVPSTQASPAPMAKAEQMPPATTTQPSSANSTLPNGPAATMSIETGLYRCEFGARVTVKRIAPDRSNIVINWKGKDVAMKAVPSQSGALRFEEPASGLVWMAIVGKSQLLDSKKGQRLANECNL
jgi:membrane-bound inhibitor of C-type lysozyme